MIYNRFYRPIGNGNIFDETGYLQRISYLDIPALNFIKNHIADTFPADIHRIVLKDSISVAFVKIAQYARKAVLYPSHFISRLTLTSKHGGLLLSVSWFAFSVRR